MGKIIKNSFNSYIIENSLYIYIFIVLIDKYHHPNKHNLLLLPRYKFKVCFIHYLTTFLTIRVDLAACFEILQTIETMTMTKVNEKLQTFELEKVFFETLSITHRSLCNNIE